MSKYICIQCDLPLNRKKSATLHKEFNPEHTILENTLKDRIIHFFTDMQWTRILRGWGLWTILLVLQNHFQLNFNFSELFFLAMGIGFIV